MSFKCDKCHQPQPTGTRPVRVVTETRHKEYTRKNEHGNVFVEGVGREIVHEENRCKECA